MKKLSILIFITICICPTFLSGQMATRQAGIRAGYASGIFYQATEYAGNAEVGYNLMLSFRNQGLQFTGLRIVTGPSINAISPDLFFVWGYGGHVGFIYTDHLGYMGERYYLQRDRFCPIFGVDGWLAAEYRFHEIPLNISLNIKPFVELTIPAFFRVMPADFGISVSYIF